MNGPFAYVPNPGVSLLSAKTREPPSFAPAEEIGYRAGIGRARVGVVDMGGEKLDKPARRARPT
jgi:hypothetical protein